MRGRSRPDADAGSTASRLEEMALAVDLGRVPRRAESGPHAGQQPDPGRPPRTRGKKVKLKGKTKGKAKAKGKSGRKKKSR